MIVWPALLIVMSCCTVGAAKYVLAVPAWSAAIVHVPAARIATVLPVTVHTSGVIDENVTGSPEDAVADTVKVPPGLYDWAGMAGKAIVCAFFTKYVRVIVTVWITVLSPIVMISTQVPVPSPPINCAGTVELSIWHALPLPSEYEIGIGGAGLAVGGRVSATRRLVPDATSPGTLKL